QAPRRRGRHEGSDTERSGWGPDDDADEALPEADLPSPVQVDEDPVVHLYERSEFAAHRREGAIARGPVDSLERAEVDAVAPEAPGSPRPGRLQLAQGMGAPGECVEHLRRVEQAEALTRGATEGDPRNGKGRAAPAPRPRSLVSLLPLHALDVRESP